MISRDILGTAIRHVLAKATPYRRGSELDLLKDVLGQRDELIQQARELNRGDQFSNSMIILGRTHPELAKAMRKYRSDTQALIEKVTA